MAALTADRNTPASLGNMREPPVKAATKIYAGAMVAIDASSWANPASASTTIKVIGRAEVQADNSAGANGDINVRVGAGIYRYGNSASADLIARKDIGSPCYAVDDQTVALTNGSGTRSVAGTIFDVDTVGVWVKFS